MPNFASAHERASGGRPYHCVRKTDFAFAIGVKCPLYRRRKLFAKIVRV